MNSCRSKSDSRRGNIILRMTFRTITTTTTKRGEENDNADTTIVNARKDLFWKTYKSGRGQYIDGDGDVTCVLKVLLCASRWVLLFISRRRRAGPTDRTADKCRSRMNAVAIIRLLYAYFKASGACVGENENRTYAIIIILGIYRYLLQLVCVCMQVRIGVDGGRTKSLSRRRRRRHRAASRRRRTHAAAESMYR